MELRANDTYLHAVTTRHIAEAVDGGPFLIGVNLKDGKAGVDSGTCRVFAAPRQRNQVTQTKNPPRLAKPVGGGRVMV